MLHGQDELEDDRKWYDFRGAGPCLCILVLMFWLCVDVLSCPCVSCCLYFYLGALHFILCDGS